MDASLIVGLSLPPGSGCRVKTTALHVSYQSNPGDISAHDREKSVNVRDFGRTDLPVVIAEGLEDGTLLLYHLAHIEAELKGTVSPADSDAAAHTGIALTTLRSPSTGSPRSLLSPDLSRSSSSSCLKGTFGSETSSKFTPRGNLYGLLSRQPDQRLRAPSAASAISLTGSQTDLTEGVSLLGVSAIDPRVSSSVTKASASAQLSCINTAEEGDLKAQLRHQAREHAGDTSALAVLAGIGRKRIEDDRKVDPVDRTSSETAGRSRPPSASEKPLRPKSRRQSESGTFEQLQAAMKDDKRMETLLETASISSHQDHTACAKIETQPNSGQGTEVPVARIILPRATKNPVVQVCSLQGQPLLAVLGKAGSCSVVDPSTSSVVAHISLENVRKEIKKASLLPPAEWRSLQAITYDQRCFLFVSGTLPDDVVMAWSDPSTTCALLEYKPAAVTLACKGFFSLAGVGPATVSAMEGLQILHQTGNGFGRYNIRFDASPAETVPDRTKAHLRIPGIFVSSSSMPNTTLPSRVPSRPGSVIDGRPGQDDNDFGSEGTKGLAKLLKRRMRGLHLDEAVQAEKTFEATLGPCQSLPCAKPMTFKYLYFDDHVGVGFHEDHYQVVHLTASSAMAEDPVPIAVPDRELLHLTRDVGLLNLQSMGLRSAFQRSVQVRFMGPCV